MKTFYSKNLTGICAKQIGIIFLLLAMAYNAGAQALVPNKICYGAPINMTCTIPANCSVSGGVYTWSIPGGSWFQVQTNICNTVTLNYGDPGYGAVAYLFSAQLPGGILISTVSYPDYKDAIVIAQTISNPKCNGDNNGSITITANGGSGYIDPANGYKWSNGATTQNISGLTAGTYIVTVTDDENCSQISSAYVLSNPTPININTTSIVNASCNGLGNGSVAVNATGGVLPYSYTWNPSGPNSAIRTGLSAGFYYVTVTDANSCTKTGSWAVIQPTAITSLNTITNATCTGCTNGTISATASGGTPNYSYNWSTGSSSQLITGLSAATYSLTITDANSCKVTPSFVVTQPAPFTCGTSTITINHTTANAVAPVAKTVTYGTVTNIPGEPTKCWITSNLGATNQATAVDDATEAAAGWYWQFNRKQGYKHDGTTRTPSTAWDATNDNLSATWEAANDPCTLELGSGWRLPTYAEWYNVDVSGGWTTWTGPWNSGLKLHAAGYLYYSDGSLYNRGSYGLYWSSNQGGSSYAGNLGFDSGISGMGNNNMANGFTARCLKPTTIPTVTTASITNLCNTTATGGGNVIADGGASVTERGVCWGTAASPSITGSHTSDGSGTGSFVSSITGLSPNTFYFIRAYATNSAGTAYGSELTFTTLAAFFCGCPVTVNHLADTVAPVTKTVTYGTVTLIPGEPTKCWITQNLGASNQATSVSDATEASAGWYWQFNKKQGFKHDGTTRTPATTWITSISENSDWLPTNDPCTLELGSGWRLPTSTEWTNVDASGGWTTWTGPYASGLKLHAAGDLIDNDGSLYYRGYYGIYWSSTQYDASNGWYLFFNSGYSGMYIYYKANGFTARCLKPTTIPTVTTAAITNISSSTATGGGNVTDDGGVSVTARGVCWSTTPDPISTGSHTTDGSGTGSFVSSITGLSLNTLYYVRAYATNSLGTAYGSELTFTSGAWVCGTSSVTVVHTTAGGVAPVAKTVTYGTVTNIPGEPTKCWITSNLGATNQATAVDDATEAAAGWYWQFNRKQGFKHDGTTRTPATAWDATNDNLSATWEAAKDPCTLELGSGWRLPTSTEWSNVNDTGGWIDWTGPYASGLKLHAAGYLDSDGSFWNRGSSGIYWSSTQYDASDGWYLVIRIHISGMYRWSKAYGYTARCL